MMGWGRVAEEGGIGNYIVGGGGATGGGERRGGVELCLVPLPGRWMGGIGGAAEVEARAPGTSVWLANRYGRGVDHPGGSA